MGFYESLADAARRNDSLLCVGLDPRVERLAPDDDLFTFNQRIVDATYDLVCAYKPNFAFYEVGGPPGLEALRRTIDYAHQKADVPVILDAKRGDIGSTAAAYARAAFEVWGADAITLNPYLGRDSLAPFAAYPEHGILLLCHTSNPGATDLQTLPCPDRPLYEAVAEKGAAWGTGLVVGATYPEALARVRALAPQAWILLPGIGAQGGEPEAALKSGLRDDGLGLIVNSSRGIIYADDPRRAAMALQKQINEARSKAVTPGTAHRAASDRSPLASLVHALADIGAVQFGEFILTSGKRSPIYIDLRLLASYPDVLRQVAHAYANLIQEKVSPSPPSATLRLAAIPYAALPIGTAVALELNLPLIYPRKETREHGTARQIEGKFQPGDRALVLDELITTGGSKLAAISPLEAAGLEVRDVVVLIDREQGGRGELEAAGYQLHAVLRLGDMLEVLVESRRITREQYGKVMAFLET